MSSGERYAIAHVTPYPWEAQDNPLNARIAAVAAELSRRGHRVLVVAPSRSQERVRASRRALWAARGRPDTLLAGTDGGAPGVIAVGEVLDVPSLTSGNGARPLTRRPPALPIDVARTIEELMGTAPLDIVHVHEPFVPSTSAAALRHSRALNVGSFHATGERGVISTLVGRRVMDTLHGRLDARIDGFARADVRDDAQANHDTDAQARATTDADAGARAGARADADELERVYRELTARRHDPDGDPTLRRRLAGRRLIDVDLHMHTDHSHDCATPVEVLLATARERGLGAIAVTDHNEISGALAARERARELDIGVQVIVGEEIKTAEQGEVIGLFIEELIPRGLTLPRTIAEIHRQGGLAYVPHPFDRMHSVPDYEHLLPVVQDIDAIEVFNARVAIGAFNDEAARFAAKYRIPGGAGSDAHVAQGLGSVRIRMREFNGPAEFMQSLLDADILTRPTSLLYVQALKFLQTRATPPSARRASRARRVKRALGGSRR